MLRVLFKRKKTYLFLFLALFAGVLFSFIQKNNGKILNRADMQEITEEDIVSNSVNENMIKVPVLMYHYVENEPQKGMNEGLWVKTSSLEEQLKMLSEEGYTFLSISDFSSIFYKNQSFPAKSVLLTFDDGYEDAYTNVFPLLKKYDAKATFFLITEKINKKGYLEEYQVKEMAEAGMNFGSHTISHQDLRTETKKRLQTDLGESKKYLEDLIGEKVSSFCYPSGEYNEDVLKELRKQGYLLAFTTKKGVEHSLNKPLEISRTRIYGRESLSLFKAIIKN